VARRPRALAFVLFATGFASILGQLVLLRELSVAFFGIELVYLLGLGAWLLASGAGAMLAQRRRVPSLAALAALATLLALVLAAELAFLRGARVLLGVAPGAFLPFTQALLTLGLGILPAALMSGLLFASAARAAVHAGRSFAFAYSVESVGALVGGLLSTLALAKGGSAAALVLVAAGVALFAAGLCGSTRASRIAVAGLGAVAALALASSARIDRALTRLNHPALLESRDTPYARYTVTRRAGQVVIFANDAVAFESESVAAETFVDPVLLAQPEPRRIAVLGVGAGDVVREVLRHAPAEVDAVELDRIALDLTRRHLPPDQTSALADPRVRLTIDDPRRFLSRAARYDVILIGVPDPDSGQTNRFYTRELFRECARHLTPAGVLGLRLRGAENLWTPQLARRMAAIDAALRTAFGHVLFLPGSVSVVLASPVPLPRDGRALGERFAARGLTAKMVSPAYLGYLFANDRVAEIAEVLARTPATPNSDSRPVCYAQAAGLWLAKFYPSLGFAAMADGDGAHGRVFVVLGPALLVGVMGLLLRHRSLARRVAVAFVAGLSGMVVEGVLILYYQSQHGVLFQDIGALLTAFMAGLALGAALSTLDESRGAGRARGRVIVLLTAALGASVVAVVTTGALTGLFEICALLLAVGASVGAMLTWASLGPADADRVVAPLYAADLAGGCVGALLGSLLLVPFFGLVLTVVLAATLALATVILI
jgi:spermidine synthase